VDGTTSAMSAQQLWAGGVPVDHDIGGNLVTAVIRGDLEHVVDGSFFKIDLPPRARVDVWLWACRRRCPRLFFLLSCDPLDLLIHVTLHQHVDNLFKRGGWILRVDL